MWKSDFNETTDKSPENLLNSNNEANFTGFIRSLIYQSTPTPVNRKYWEQWLNSSGEDMWKSDFNEENLLNSNDEANYTGLILSWNYLSSQIMGESWFFWLNSLGEDMWKSDFNETTENGKNQQSPENLLNSSNEANYTGFICSWINLASQIMEKSWTQFGWIFQMQICGNLTWTRRSGTLISQKVKNIQSWEHPSDLSFKHFSISRPC